MLSYNRVALIIVSGFLFVFVVILTNGGSNPPTSHLHSAPSSPSSLSSDEMGLLPKKNLKSFASSSSSAETNEDEKDQNESPNTNKTVSKMNNGKFSAEYCSSSSFKGGSCKKWFASMAKRYFRIHHIHSHDFSIERKVVRMFGPSLAELFCTQALSLSSSQNSAQHDVLVIDVGVNDAEDIPYWFERFGYIESSSIFLDPKIESCQKLLNHQSKQQIRVDFRLFEPQQMYRGKIEGVLKRELKRGISGTASRQISVHGAFDAVAVGSEAQHGSTAMFYGKGEQASLGSKGKHANVGKPVEVRVGSLAKMLDSYIWKKSDLFGAGVDNAKTKQSDEEEQHSSSNQQQQQFFASKDAPILFMKVDCEGADPTIIVGSESLFAEHRVHLLVFELHKNEKGFPKKFVDSTAMLTKNGYEVFLLGKCTSSSENGGGGSGGGIMLVKMDTKAASQWTPQLEAGIAISPQLQKVLYSTTSTSSSISKSLGEYFGGVQLSSRQKYPCGVGWEYVPKF